jgi:hypothetical protein
MVFMKNKRKKNEVTVLKLYRHIVLNLRIGTNTSMGLFASTIEKSHNFIIFHV